MVDAQTITNNLPVMTITVPFDDSSYTYDVQTGKRFGSFGEHGSDAFSGSRFTEGNPPDQFVEALVYLFLHRPDDIVNENDSFEARAKFLKQYEANQSALLEQGERPIGLSKEDLERLSRACIQLGFTKTDSFSVDQQKDLRDFLEVERTR
jgi:hypothetical protein